MIHTGDCIEVMRGMAADSVDAVVTDPPYGLEFMGKRWDAFKSPGRGARVSRERAAELTPKGKGHTTSKGPFLAAGVDQYIAGSPFQAWCEAWGREALRVTKPGGYLLAFGGTRTHHRLVCGLEDAGWIIRDELQHIYASGFPKSHNVNNSERFCHCGREAVPKHDVRAMRDGDVSAPVAASSGQRTLLFEEVPEPDVSAAPNRSVEVPLRSGEPGVEGRRDLQATEGQLPRGSRGSVPGLGDGDVPVERVRRGASASDGSLDGPAARADGSGKSQGSQSSEQRSVEPRVVAVERDAQGGGGWPMCDRCGKPQVPPGLGTALKPAHEPIILARKPLAGTVAQNVTRYGTGALNIGATRVGHASEADAAQHKANSEPWTQWERGGSILEEAKGMNTPGRIAPMPETAKGRWPSNLLLSDPELFDEPNPQIIGSGSSEEGAGYSRFFTIPQGKEAEGCWPWTGATDEIVREARRLHAEGSTFAALEARFGIDQRVISKAVRGLSWKHVPADDPEHPIGLIIPKADRADREPIVGDAAVLLHRARGECDKLTAWERPDQSPNEQTDSSSPERAISAEPLAGAESSSSATSSPGKPPTDPSPRATRSTISTATSRTTGSPTSSSSTPPVTSESTPDASLSMGFGGSPAPSASSSVPSSPSGGTSPSKDGPSTGAVGPATSGKSSRRNRCALCGKPLPRVGTHPTTKPTDLMRHLIRLVTPPGGRILDPFLGSGTTGIAAELEGFEWVGIEQSDEYVAIAEARLNGTQRGLGLDVPLVKPARKKMPPHVSEGHNSMMRGLLGDEEPAA